MKRGLVLPCDGMPPRHILNSTRQAHHATHSLMDTNINKKDANQGCKTDVSKSGTLSTLPSPEICVICLDLISDRATTLPCQHNHFDFACLGTWLQQSQRCPLCKATVLAVRYTTREGQPHIFHLPNDTSTLPRRPPHRHHSHRRTNHDRTKPTTPPDPALTFRQTIYRHNIPSLHIGSNRHSRYRNITPSSFSDAQLTQRARTWIRRELSLFSFLDPSSSPAHETGTDRRATNAEYLLEYMIAILKSIDLKGSQGQAEELIAEYLGRDNARLFLHELEAWLRSPFEKVADWDRVAQYRLDGGRVVNGMGEMVVGARSGKQQ